MITIGIFVAACTVQSLTFPTVSYNPLMVLLLCTLSECAMMKVLNVPETKDNTAESIFYCIADCAENLLFIFGLVNANTYTSMMTTAIALPLIAFFANLAMLSSL